MVSDKQSSGDPASPQTREDFSVDLSRIKKWFSGAKKAPGQQSKQDERPHAESDQEISLDWKKAAGYLWRYRVVFLILVPLLIGAWVRLEGQELLPMERSALSNVHTFIVNDLRASIASQYPNLPNANRERIVSDEFRKAVAAGQHQVRTGQFKGNTFDIAQETERTAAQLKDAFQYDVEGGKYTYMPDIDPYTYMRWAKNYLEKGHIGDEVRDGVQWDNHMRAPLGDPVDKTYHPQVLAWLYRVMYAFNGKITLMQAAGYFPVLFSVLAVIPAFFLARRIGGNTAGFFAGLLIATNNAFLGRTTWGHADTDAYTILFPLLIAWLFIEGFEHQSRKWQVGLTAAAGLSTGLFAVFWSGWWYIFDFIVAVIGFVFLYTLWSHRAALKRGIGELSRHVAVRQAIIVGVVFVLSSGIFVSAFSSFADFTNAPLNPLDFIQIKAAARGLGTTIWPNVLTTVAELNEADYRQVIDASGGKLIFAVALLGVLLTLLRRDAHGKRDIKYAVFLLIWFVATMYASSKGIRFIMLVAPTLSVAFGIAVGASVQLFGGWMRRELHVPQWVFHVVLVVSALVIVAPTVQAAIAIGGQDLPIMNDAWVGSLTKIRETSKPDAIITSWWDFGHHFKWYADRPVTFDGASQNEPMAHWVGKLLLTDDEALAAGILRMLDCGSNRAYETLDAVNNDTSVSVKQLYQVVVQDRTLAKEYLLDRGLTDMQAGDVLKYTHCDPPEGFVIASQDMIGKSGVWGHFGSWDFDRADIWVFARKLPRQQAIDFIVENSEVSEDRAEAIYNEVKAIRSESDGNAWIAPWPSYASGIIGCDRKDNRTIRCDQVEIDIQTMDARIVAQGGSGHVRGIVFPTENGTTYRKFDDAKADVSVVFIPSPEGHRIILAQPAMANSMFTRMFFYQGHGLRYFKPFDSTRDIGGNFIFTFKVDWMGKEPNIVYKLVETNETAPKAVNASIQVNESSSVSNVSDEVGERVSNGTGVNGS